MQLPCDDFALARLSMGMHWQDSAETEVGLCISSFDVTMLGFIPCTSEPGAPPLECAVLARSSKMTSCLKGPSGQSCICVLKLWSLGTPCQNYRM